MINKFTIASDNPIMMDDLTADEEFITAGEFENATRTVVRTLGKNFDVDIVYAGNGAKTDGKTVFLPAQDQTKVMTKKQYAVGQGFANHETMHNLCTDIKTLLPRMKEMKKEGKKLAVMFGQAIEDVRIERTASMLYPGIPKQIASTADYAAKAFNDEYIDGGNNAEMLKDFKRIGPIALTWRGRQRLGYDSKYIDKCLSALPQDIIDKLDKWCDMIDGIETGALGAGELDQSVAFKGSHKGLELAELIVKDIEDVDDEDEDEDEQSGDGSMPPPPNAQSNQQPPQKPQNQKDEEPVDVDMTALVQDLLNKGDGKAPKAIPVSTMCDSWITKGTHENENMNRRGGEKRYQETVSNMSGRIAVMKRKLERALFTASQEDYVSGQRSGRLDVRSKAVSIMQRRENIYRRKVDGKNIDTSVTLLVDCSGSMSGSRIKIATNVAIALAECFERTSVSLEVLGFTCGFTEGDYTEQRDANGKIMESRKQQFNNFVSDAVNSKNSSKFHRSEPIKMFEFKPFDGKMREYKNSLGNMVICSDSSTPDGEAILKATARLMAQKNPKKIMFVLCDGDSSYNTVNSVPPREFTKKAVAYAQSLGIHVVGIGIQSNSVKTLYNNWSVVESLADLDKQVIDKLARLILGDKFNVDNGDLQMVKDNYQKKATR